MDYKKAIRKYLLFQWVFVALASFGILFLYFTNKILVSFIMLLVYWAIMTFVAPRIASRYFLSILFKDLDPLKFKLITEHKSFSFSFIYIISAEISLGNYQTVVNLLTAKLNTKSCSVKSKCLCLGILARVYFELRDVEKLKTLIAQYDAENKLYSSNKFFQKQSFLWDYYRCYVNGNYEKCKEICHEWKRTLKQNKWNFNHTCILNSFHYAVACFENGEMDEAKKEFAQIIEIAPKMFFADISQKYIEAIERNQVPIISNTEILPNENLTISYVGFFSKRYRLKMIRYILFSLALLCIIVSFLLLIQAGIL